LTLPDVTTTVMPVLTPTSGVIWLDATPFCVTVTIGFAIPSATTLKVTGVPSSTGVPVTSVTVATTVELETPSHETAAGEALSAMLAAGPAATATEPCGQNWMAAVTPAIKMNAATAAERRSERSRGRCIGTSPEDGETE
jgi:hypothetical protein